MIILERIAEWFALNKKSDTAIRMKSLAASFSSASVVSFDKTESSSLSSTGKLLNDLPVKDTVSGDELSSGPLIMPKSKFPTHIKDESSIVQLFVTSHEPDYDEPWNGTHIQSCTGTGIVIDHEGEKYILTNAHCVSNQIRTQIRLANNREKKFDALPICVSYQCDLALLKVKSPKFQTMAKPINLGGMVGLHDEVFTMGFPVGGDEISVTKGIVSRIEVQDYSMSDLPMLQVQVDAAINPGNSGGPVFSNGKVVGVAFQGCNEGEGLGYMIPMPIVKHFLREVFSGHPYRGFPVLPIDTKMLKNKWLRHSYGMSKGHTGVLVSKIDLLCDAHEKLQEGDVLLEIDGYKISNQGTVDIPGVGNCINMLHVTHMKFMGETVHLKILRKNKGSKAKEAIKIHEMDVVLDHVPLETSVVPQMEYDKMPTYYLNSGFVFVPVSRNFLKGVGASLEDETIVDSTYGVFRVIDMPKTALDHQLVAINAVLDCKATDGYDDLAPLLVKKVNGKAIKNLNELIEAMESNDTEKHLIESYSHERVTLKKLSRDELQDVMASHKIAFDRSEDLRAKTLHSDVSAEDLPKVGSKRSSTSTQKTLRRLTVDGLDSAEISGLPFMEALQSLGRDFKDISQKGRIHGRVERFVLNESDDDALSSSPLRKKPKFEVSRARGDEDKWIPFSIMKGKSKHTLFAAGKKPDSAMAFFIVEEPKSAESEKPTGV